MFKLPGNCSGAFEIEVCGDLLKLLIALRGVASYRGERRDESMVLLLASRGGQGVAVKSLSFPLGLQ